MNHYCHEASRLISDGYERELGMGERLRLRLHLWMCGACSNYRFNMQLMNRLLSNMRMHADAYAPCLSEQERQSILAAVEKQSQSDT